MGSEQAEVSDQLTKTATGLTEALGPFSLRLQECSSSDNSRVSSLNRWRSRRGRGRLPPRCCRISRRWFEDIPSCSIRRATLIMPVRDGRNIAEQNASYRRGVVLGLTMAEVGILVIFVLLLLIGFNEWTRVIEQEKAKDNRSVSIERLAGLETAERQLADVVEAMQLPASTTMNPVIGAVSARTDGYSSGSISPSRDLAGS